MLRMRFAARAVFVSVVCMASSGALGSVYTLVPEPNDLYDLSHSYHYTWGIDRPWSETEEVTSATLSFSQIRNWREELNVLYIHLLDEAPLGVVEETDTKFFNEFYGEGTRLVVYINLPDEPIDLTYEFDAAEIKALNDYAPDGRFGLGFDPDCHFYNEGVELVVTVPEPATASLLVTGPGLMLIRRRRRLA